MAPRSRSVARRRHGGLVVVAGLTIVLAACGRDAGDPGPSGPTPPSGAVEAAYLSLGDLPDEVAAALADASERFGVPVEEIAVAGALRVTWSDGSLGCPEPDMMYTQPLVPGYLLTLEVAGQRYQYHGADGDVPFLCER